MHNDSLVVIPAFNEGGIIGKVLEPLLAANLGIDVAVINDGSTDSTLDVVRTFPQVLIASHPCNLGYGAALQTGYQLATSLNYEYVAQFDADGQHSVDDLRRVLDAIWTVDADVVIGSRFLSGQRIPLGFGKVLAIRLFRRFIYMFTRNHITDPTSGLKAFRNVVFSHYSKSKEYPFDYPDADVLIDILLHGWRIIEVPVGSYDRETGISMHSGLRPLIYMAKVAMSIFVVLLNELLRKRGLQR